MSKSKISGIIIWVLGLALSLFLLFIIPESYNTAIIVTAVFTVIAFVSQLVLWLVMLRGNVGAQGVFYRTPTFTFSSAYLIIQFVICIVTAFVSMSTKVSLIVNFVVLVLMWILVIALSSAKDHATRVDSRQKNHHVEL